MTPILAASAGDVLVWIVWVAAAAACLLSAVGVVSFADPFYSALALIGNLASLAVLYLLLSAEFVAAAQVLIYAGAIVVMFLFVIAYVGGRADAPWAGSPSVQTWAAIAAAGAILAEVLVVIGVQAGGGDLTTEADISAAFGGPAAIGELFLTDHVLAFEITSIVLLVAAIGGVILGSHARRFDEGEADVEVLGPDVAWYLAVAAFLFTVGALGVLLRRNPLIVLLSLELMLNAANLTLIAFARQHGSLDGQIFALAVMAVAASEVVVGLGLVVAMARRNVALDTDRLTTLRG